LAADPTVDRRRAQRAQGDRLDPQPCEHRLLLGADHFAGAELGLTQPEHGEPELAGES